MVMKRSNRILSAFLSAVMVVGLFAPTAVKADTVSGEMTAPVPSNGEEGYFAYYDAHASVPFAAESIRLQPGDAQLTDGATLESGHLGAERSVRLSKGAATWTVHVPAEARYLVQVTYVTEKGNRMDSNISLAVDGEVPFEEAGSIPLNRIWKDATKILQDSIGNDSIPDQEQVLQWSTVALQDFAILNDRPLYFWLTGGEHTITLRNWSEEALHIASVELTQPPQVPTDDEARAAYTSAGYREIEGYFRKLQAELPALKSSQSIYPTYDRSSPATEPYDAYNIRRNTIGDGNWSDPGTWVSYVIEDVPADGLYYITLKYRQHQMIGTSTFRTILVNGSVPSEAYQNVAFPYNINWKNQTVSDENGQPVAVYLTEGKNEIRIQATVGAWSEVLRRVEAANHALNQMYIQMVMITGTTPDKYFDYNLESEIPDLLSCFREQRNVLEAMAAEFDQMNGGKTTQSETLRNAVSQLDSMIKDPKSIPQRIGNFRDTISTLSSWVYDNMNQSLEMDYLMVHSADAEIPSAKAGFWASLKHAIVTFFLSFVKDYSMVGSTDGAGETITVWTTSGRDQASILMNLITENFTAETGIQVNVSLVQAGFIEATLAGTGPDVAIGVSRGQPVNLACRGALVDLRQFDTFEEVTNRFSETAMVPYEYENGTYAVPNTQGYYMLFYRKDIMEKLNLQIPQTWDELLRLVPRLQKNHMEIGLPYSTISAAVAVNNGMGAKDIFPVLLLQNGGDLYNPAGTASALASDAGMNAFKQWCDYYTQYGFELVYDFYTRFRNGDMPIGISDLAMYNTLVAGAPELQGEWGIAPIPGTVQPDGSIDRSTGSIGSATVMFKTKANEDKAHREACWKFMEWWMRTDTQDAYNEQVENVMGPAGRNATANLESFAHLPWSEEEKEALDTQRAYVKDLREVPGSYFVSRCIDNAFRAVFFDGDNAREVFEQEVESIDREIARKRQELGLD